MKPVSDPRCSASGPFRQRSFEDLDASSKGVLLEDVRHADLVASQSRGVVEARQRATPTNSPSRKSDTIHWAKASASSTRATAVGALRTRASMPIPLRPSTSTLRRAVHSFTTSTSRTVGLGRPWPRTGRPGGRQSGLGEVEGGPVHVLVPGDEASDACAAGRVPLRDGVHHDCKLLGPRPGEDRGGERAHGHVVDELAVHLVGDVEEPVSTADVGQSVQLLLGQHHAGRVAGGGDHHGPRRRSDGGLDLAEIDVVAVRRSRGPASTLSPSMFAYPA